MLRRGDDPNRNPQTGERAVMKLLFHTPVLLFCDFFRRLIWTLRGRCCLETVFIFLTDVQCLVLLHVAACLSMPDDVYQPYPAAKSDHLFFLPSRRSPLLSV